MAKREFDRWVSIGKDVLLPTLRMARRLGMGLVDGWKPGMCCWYAFRFKATSEQMKALQNWWDRQSFEWFQRMPRGAWRPRQGEVLDWEEAMGNVEKSSGR